MTPARRLRAAGTGAALAGLLALPASAEQMAPAGLDRAFTVFAEACLGTRPDFRRSGVVFARLGLAPSGERGLYATGDGAIVAVASEGGRLDVEGSTCSVVVVPQSAVDGPVAAAVARLIGTHVDAPLTEHEATGLAAGAVSADEGRVWTWTEPAGRGKAVVMRDADRGTALSLVMAPLAGAEARP